MITVKNINTVKGNVLQETLEKSHANQRLKKGEIFMHILSILYLQNKIKL